MLLHTLRTQLDLFQKVIPDLASSFQVYALDYPGHGYSDIPNTDYTPEFFVTSVTRFLEQLSIADAVIAGESIGGNIALALAARRNPRVRQAVAINPADYGASRALRRSSTLANLLFGLNDIPVLGPTVMRLRTYEVTKKIFEGGVYRKDALPPGLAHEMYEVGNRRGHYRAFMSLVRHGPEWERARQEYGNIVVPTLLLYGDRDWSRPQEREYTARAIPGARTEVLKDVGHFASLDAPQQVVRAILDFLGEAV